MPISGHPGKIPGCAIRAPIPSSRVFDGKALVGPRMKDSRAWEPSVGDLHYSPPRHGVLLAAALKRAPPEVDVPALRSTHSAAGSRRCSWPFSFFRPFIIGYGPSPSRRGYGRSDGRSPVSRTRSAHTCQGPRSRWAAGHSLQRNRSCYLPRLLIYHHPGRFKSRGSRIRVSPLCACDVFQKCRLISVHRLASWKPRKHVCIHVRISTLDSRSQFAGPVSLESQTYCRYTAPQPPPTARPLLRLGITSTRLSPESLAASWRHIQKAFCENF